MFIFNNGYQQVDPTMNRSDYMDTQENIPENPYNFYSMDPAIPYPTPPSQMSVPPTLNPSAYAHGGKIKTNKKNASHSWAKKLRKMGNNGDTELVHVNPLEEKLLKSIGGSGTINPKTGLRQYGLFSNPKKWFKSVIGPAGGAILGNILLPGGGALGGAAGSAARGRKDFGQAAIRGLGMGAIAPTAASLVGGGLNKLGASSIGGTLSRYGERNAILPALDRLLGSSRNYGLGAGALGMNNSNPDPMRYIADQNGSALENYNRYNGLGVAAGSDYYDDNDDGFVSKLTKNTKNYLSKPKNLLALASVASSFANRPKEKSPESIASDKKRLEKALMLTPEERKAKEADLLAEARMRRSIARNQFLPEERLGNLEPLYRRSHTPEEQKNYGRWFSYYNNPNFTGEPLPFKNGGLVEEVIIGGMNPSSGLIGGRDGGQADTIPTGLPDKSYIIEASTLSDLGDGNTLAGADKVKALVSSGEYYISPEDVARFGKIGAKKLDRLVKNVRKHKRGGRTTLPPKAKPLSNYLK